MGVKHAFASAKSDGADATLVRPSNWNADHTIDSFTLPNEITVNFTTTQNDYSPTGLATAAVIRWSAAASPTLTGISAGSDGRMLIIENLTTDQALTLANENTGSAAANRFLCPEQLPFSIGALCSVIVIYDGTAQRWRIAQTLTRTNKVPLGPTATGDQGIDHQVTRADHAHPYGNTLRAFRADFSLGGALSVGAGTFRWYNDSGLSLQFREVRVSCGTAPTGAALIVDVNNNGTTIFTTQTNRPQCSAGANTGTTTTFNVVTIQDGNYITVDIDQVGSTVAGADLTVQIWMSLA
jgi:hypothetical protein